MTDPVKEKIQELLPDIKWEREEHDYKDGFDYTIHAPITLAVVLRAIGKLYPTSNNQRAPYYFCDMYGNICDRHDLALATWNLEHDNYDDQDEATKAFIGSLLGV